MSVTVPPAGTRGSRFPKFPGLLARFFSRLQLRMFRRGKGGSTPGGAPTLVLETTGAKSGEKRYAVLGYVDEAPNSWLVMASLAGSARNPGWLYNLARRPEATIELAGGGRVRVSATSLAGPELDAGWKKFSVAAPEYAKYLTVTDRAMPIVRLRAVETDASGATATAIRA
jgi:deazaflavin-dependent oxidoreductase (nitroreductase family)